jgi:hypothetical protein
MHYVNGDVYVGHWLKGKKNGFGILTSYSHSGVNTETNPNSKKYFKGKKIQKNKGNK